MAQSDWSPIRNALRACSAAGAMPAIWWRDDDAVAPTPALDQLCAVSNSVGVPVHLAVIPAQADPMLADYCGNAPVIPVVHGWAHADHSAAGDKKNEFLTLRPEAIAETERGLSRMRHLFGDALRTMFVPPWNRIHPDIVTALPQIGYTALSTFGPRNVRPGCIAQINTHVDPIDWKGTRGLVDPGILIAVTASQLLDRATGRADASEPLGLLTHHLVHDPAIWNFIETFLSELLQGGATLWQMEL